MKSTFSRLYDTPQ